MVMRLMARTFVSSFRCLILHRQVCAAATVLRPPVAAPNQVRATDLEGGLKTPGGIRSLQSPSAITSSGLEKHSIAAAAKRGENRAG